MRGWPRRVGLALLLIAGLVPARSEAAQPLPAAGAPRALMPAPNVSLPPLPPPTGRLPLAPPAPLPADGAYLAQGDLKFTLDHFKGQVRLKFDGNEEVFYLSSEPAPLGGHVLKYDSGDVAMQVTGWGGVTLYTVTSRGGVPAEHAGDGAALDAAPVPAQGLKPIAAKLQQELSQRASISVGFDADWDAFSRLDMARSLAAEAMRNAAYALEQLSLRDKAAAIAAKLHIVRVVQAGVPTARVTSDGLTVSVSPDRGPSARPSSIIIARVLAAGF